MEAGGAVEPDSRRGDDARHHAARCAPRCATQVEAAIRRVAAGVAQSCGVRVEVDAAAAAIR